MIYETKPIAPRDIKKPVYVNLDQAGDSNITLKAPVITKTRQGPSDEDIKHALARKDLPPNLRAMLELRGAYAEPGPDMDAKLSKIIAEMGLNIDDFYATCSLAVNYIARKLAEETNTSFHMPADVSALNREVNLGNLGKSVGVENAKMGDWIIGSTKEGSDNHTGVILGEDRDNFWVPSINELVRDKKGKIIARQFGIAKIPKKLAQHILRPAYNDKSVAPITVQASAKDTAPLSADNTVGLGFRDFFGGVETKISERRFREEDAASALFDSPEYYETKHKLSSGDIATVKSNIVSTSPKKDSIQPVSDAVQITAGLMSELKVDTLPGKPVSWLVFREILRKTGKLTTEEGSKWYFADGSEAPYHQALGYCYPDEVGSIELLRYSHWDKILNGLGLGKYAGILTPPGANEENGMTFGDFVPKLMDLICADHPRLSSQDALIAASKQGFKA